MELHLALLGGGLEVVFPLLLRGALQVGRQTRLRRRAESSLCFLFFSFSVFLFFPLWSSASWLLGFFFCGLSLQLELVLAALPFLGGGGASKVSLLCDLLELSLKVLRQADLRRGRADGFSLSLRLLLAESLRKSSADPSGSFNRKE